MFSGRSVHIRQITTLQYTKGNTTKRTRSERVLYFLIQTTVQYAFGKITNAFARTLIAIILRHLVISTRKGLAAALTRKQNTTRFSPQIFRIFRTFTLVLCRICTVAVSQTMRKKIVNAVTQSSRFSILFAR